MKVLSTTALCKNIRDVPHTMFHQNFATNNKFLSPSVNCWIFDSVDLCGQVLSKMGNVHTNLNNPIPLSWYIAKAFCFPPEMEKRLCSYNFWESIGMKFSVSVPIFFTYWFFSTPVGGGFDSFIFTTILFFLFLFCGQ